MSFLKNVEGTLNKLGKKSGEVMGAAKVKVEIAKLSNDMNKKKTDLGNAVYQNYTTGNQDNSVIVSICEEIKEIEQKIRQLESEAPKEDLVFEEGVSYCSACGAALIKDAKFCNNCGNKVS
ncbi:MAG: zinc ribbon domain-containing protein [Bacillota bacterium]